MPRHTDTLSGRLGAARRARKVSQRTLADAVGVTRQTVNRWENDSDAAGRISYDQLRKIADTLDIAFGELVPECDDDEPHRRAA